MRILNAQRLASHGHVAGRKAMVEILEAGLTAADPYYHVRRMVRREGQRLIVGGADYDPAGSPRTGEEVYDLDEIDRILVVGAGKGVQYAAKALEEALGDRLTGGHVIAKHGDRPLLQRIGVTYGGHPVPDEGCVAGCRRIIEVCRGLTPRDLVFTIALNGVSSLLTLPAPGLTLDEVRQVTWAMQIERGVPTQDLNPIRNHLDRMKGGRASRYLLPARVVHLVVVDPSSYHQLVYANRFLHWLPDCGTFAEAQAMLDKWNAWDAMPASVQCFLRAADPAYETVQPEEFLRWNHRILGVLPAKLGTVPSAQKRAEELGFRAYVLARGLQAEAREAGLVVAQIALTVERAGLPFEPPCALLTSGELLVTVGEENGIGGRNQEFVLSAAPRIAGSANIVMGAVDTDGTDGPGGRFAEDCEDIPCLAGGIVDGYTADEARLAGVDLLAAIRQHNTSPALWALNSGIAAEQNNSAGDLGVTLILGRR